MAAEVDQLCGPKHQPHGGDLFRAGNSSGRVLVDGEREEVIRPRVRERQKKGSTSEVTLASYESASNPEELQDSIVLALMTGVSTREISDVKPRSPSVSKSNVSRLWQSVGHKFVDQLRGQSLLEQDWTVLMLEQKRCQEPFSQIPVLASCAVAASAQPRFAAGLAGLEGRQPQGK